MESERIINLQRRLKLWERTCAQCGQTFQGWGVQRFCSPPCQRRWDYHQHVEKRRATRRAYYRRQREQRTLASKRRGS
jgi:tRNA(Ile2) C34 agmatinyltransferase TiaS